MDGLEQLRFITYNEQGERMECDVILTFEAVASGNDIIVYTDNTQDDAGNLRIYASVYNPEELEAAETGELVEMALRPIEHQADWDMVNEVFREMAALAAEESGPEGSEESVVVLEEDDHSVINVHYPE